MKKLDSSKLSVLNDLLPIKMFESIEDFEFHEGSRKAIRIMSNLPGVVVDDLGSIPKNITLEFV